MTEDILIRLALLAAMAGGFTISATHRRRANKVGGKVSREKEGTFAAVLLRGCGSIAFGSLVVYVAYPPAISWAHLELPQAVRWMGVAAVWGGIPLVYWTFSNLGTNITDTVNTRPDHKLVTTGPYRWVRHPLYAVGAVSWLGICLATASWWITFWIASGFAILARRTTKEEADLIERFGDEYRDYMQRTGRFFPHLVA